MDFVNNFYETLHNNKYVSTILTTILVIYGSMAAPSLPSSLKKLFNNVVFKVHELCQPCKYLQNKLEVKNLVKLLAFKSGVRAEILISGEISINDQIKIIK